MKIVSLLLAALTAFPVANAFAAPDDERFQKLANEYIEQTLQMHPEQATELGDHRFDDRLTDYSAEARAKELAAARTFREKLNTLGPDAKLSAANSVDLRILKDSGLVTERRQGTRRYYRARVEGLAELRAFLEVFLGEASWLEPRPGAAPTGAEGDMEIVLTDPAEQPVIR